MPAAFEKLLVANRGEVAARILRSARALGLKTVAIHSEADVGAEYLRFADEAVCIGPAAPTASYLSIDRIVAAARATGADALHPGYGFLAENADFAEACSAAGVVFVGPSAAAIRAMGDKARAKTIMEAAGVPCVPGYQGEDQSLERLAAEAERIGYPVMIKATAGGGGRGMRLVDDASLFADRLASARSEARAAFDSDAVLIEKAIVNPRHIEIQVMADRHGNVVHLGERDCSLQRRHQKVIEEAPSPAVSPALRERMGGISTEAARAIGYEGAGTFEYLLDANGAFYFMEMNTRLQVEHPVTEAITGLDLVSLQLQVAMGRPLPLGQDGVRFNGHAIEARLCAEDPEAGFVPQSGVLSLWRPAEGLRCDHALRDGASVPPHYDSMIAKVVAHGPDREAARRALASGLERTLALGLRTNQAFLGRCLRHEEFAAGATTTAFIEAHRDTLLPDPAPALRRAGALLGAVLYGRPDAELPHGFATPLRFGRGDRTFAYRVTAGRHGACSVEGDDALSLTVLARAETGDGGMHEIRADLVLDGVRRSVVVLCAGSRFWIHTDGGPWDFDDLRFAPLTTARSAGDGKVRAAMTGTVVSVAVSVDDMVAAGQKVMVLEAMKMEHVHSANAAGRVRAVHVRAGDQVEAHRVVVEIEPL